MYINKIGGDHVSGNKTVHNGGYSISDALYDAKRSEVMQTVIISLIFLFGGLITVIVSFVKYFGVLKTAAEPSDSIDANSWLVIAAVGAVIAIIGIVSTVKSLTSISGIASSIKGMMTSVSPFQQPLNRNVAVMNQSQSMQKPMEKGMAEENKAVGNLGFLKIKKPASKTSGTTDDSKGSKIYDKYNKKRVPAASVSKSVTAPPKSEPLRVQKFDYGINEEREKSFAENFLAKNKRDPFAQHRKELGIKDEAEAQSKAPKPQFIASGRSVQNKTVQNQQVSNSTASQKTFNREMNIRPDNQVQTANYPLNNGNLTSGNHQSHNIQTSHNPAISTVTDDDFFLSFSNTTVSQPVYQQQTENLNTHRQNTTVEKITQNDSKSVGTDVSYSDDDYFLNYNTTTDDETYDLSLFEDNSDSSSTSETDSPAEKSNRKDKESNQQYSAPAQSTGSNKSINLSYGIDSENDFEVLSYTGMDAVNSGEVALNYVEPVSSNNIQQPLSYRPESSAEYSSLETSFNTANRERSASENKPVSNVEKTFNRKPETNAGKKINSGIISGFKKIGNKKSADEVFNKETPSKQNVNHEICINGTKSQRKFVDASEYDEWTCPECGKVNQEYVGVCCCGRRKPHKKY